MYEIGALLKDLKELDVSQRRRRDKTWTRVISGSPKLRLEFFEVAEPRDNLNENPISGKIQLVKVRLNR